MSSVQVQISQLPPAGPITGTEAVPIVQNGQTLRTTTGAIASGPALTATFLTQSQETSLVNSRYLSTSTGLGLTDGGPTSFLRLSLNGASGSLETVASGIVVKNGSNAVVSRSIAVSGLGLAVANANGTGGNPTLSLNGIAGAIANLGGTGFIGIVGGTTATERLIAGTANQITVANGNGAAGNPTILIADDPTLPGTGAMRVPVGTNAQQPAGINGQIRYNSDILAFEGYSNGGWGTFLTAGGVLSFSGGTTGLTPSVPIGGNVVLGGTVVPAHGGTGANTLTGYVKGNGTSAMTASTTIPNSDITGLGTMATQNASAVAITGGTITGTGISGATITGSTIDGTTIGAGTAAAGTFTTVAMTSGTVSSTPVNPTDIVNKDYADSLASGLNYHQPANYATTAALAAYTYNNGASGVGATITANANGALSLGGGSPTATQRVLIKDEPGAAAAYNGVYVVTNAGSPSTPFVLTRATDYDTTGAGTNEIDQGDYILVISGTLASTAWVQQTPLPITIGTTTLTYVQFNAPVTYSAGTGLTLAGTTFSITNTGVSAASYGSASQVPVLAINAQGQVTSASNTSIAISSSAVSGLAASATTDTTNAANITSGTLPSARLSGSYTGITGVGTLVAGTWNASTIGVGYGGTGLTATPTNGQLAIGNGSGYSLANLSAGTNVTITNTAGGITISATPSFGGTVTSVNMTVPSFLTVSGNPITTSGTLAVAYSGTALPVANGGTGAGTLTGYLYGNGTSAFTASTTIPNSAITGLGTMSTQNAGAVAITGGTIEGTTVGATTASIVRGTTVTATIQFTGSGAGLTSIPNSATTATAVNTASTIVARDASGNFAAGTITAALNGNASTATSATTATTATSATTASNVALGAANQVVYQTGSGATSFITAPSSSNTYLSWNGTSFTWAAAGTGTVTSVAVSGGTTGLTTSGGPVTTSGTITFAGTLVAANGGTGLSTYTVGDLLYASGTSALSKLALGTSGYVLTAGASAPAYVAQSTLSVGNATTATNIGGGAAGSLPYNTGSGATAFLALGTTGYVLTAGASAPAYVAQSTLSVGSATNATNTAITANSTNAPYYLTFVSATSGNLPQLVNSTITCNPSTGAITGGISGGTF